MSNIPSLMNFLKMKSIKQYQRYKVKGQEDKVLKFKKNTLYGLKQVVRPQ